MKTWHYDGLGIIVGNQDFSPNFVQIEVRNQGESSPPPIIDKFPFGFAPAEFQFGVTAIGQVKEIIVREDGLGLPRSRLNAFTLISIPEPTGSTLAAIALANFMTFRRSRRSYVNRG
jgi:hypothetical protein